MKNYYLSRLLTLVVLFGVSITLTTAQTVEVTAPASIAGTYTAGDALFGDVGAGFTGEVVEVTDVNGMTTACVAVDNGVADVTGKIALIDRGGCAFTLKAVNAQNAGAIGVIICNSDQANPDAVINLGGGRCDVNVPVAMLSFNDCQTIRMETGVMATYNPGVTPSQPNEYLNMATEIGEGTFTVDSISGQGGLFTGSAGGAFYKYTATADGVLNVNSCGGGADTRLLILDCVANLLTFSIDDCDDGASNIVASTADLLVTAGQEVFILWDDAQSADGFNFNVTLNSLPSVITTFTVNMEEETVSGDGVLMVYAPPGVTELNEVSVLPMTDNGDGTWSADISLTTLDTIGYAFVNGALDVPNVEAVPDECGLENAFGFNIRPYIEFNIVNSSVAPVCFSSCTNCPSVVGTFTVDMTNEVTGPDGVTMLVGAPGVTDVGDVLAVPMTDNMDGTWSASVDLTSGDTIGYAFMNGALAVENVEVVPEECGLPSGFGFNIRPFIVSGFDDFNVAKVCFSTCSEFCPDLECDGMTPLIADDFESYTAGETTGPQTDYWTTWSGTEGGADDGIVSDDQAASGSNSMLIAEAQTQDVLLLLGEQTSGAYRLEWNAYIPAGATGYYNIQEEETPGVQWNLDVFFNDGGGAPGTGSVDQTGTTFSYPEDAWFSVVHYIDLDNDKITLIVDGTFVEEAPFPDNLGAINFFSIDDDNRYYIDDVRYYEINGVDNCNDVVASDGMEFYMDESTISDQSAFWTTWSGTEGGADDGIVTSEQAYNGCNSVLIAEGQTQDVLLLLGNQTSGRYELRWWEYVPAGATAYFNIQEDEEPGVQWNLDVFFNEGGGAPGTGTVDQTGNTFTYPEDEWFEVIMIVDLDNDELILSVDGTTVEEGYDYPGDQLGSINFFSIDATNRYFLDDVQYMELEACGTDPESSVIICDPVEFGEGAKTGPQTSWWTTWSGTEGDVDDGIVSTEQARSGCTSLLLEEGTTQDVLLLLGNQTTGTYNLQWYQYVRADATAYFNIQEDETPAVAWNIDVHFNEDSATPGMGAVDQTGTTFSYPEDQWFLVQMIVDLDDSVMELWIDGVQVEAAYAYPGAQLGAINFYASDAANYYFIDDVLLEELPPSAVNVTFQVAVPPAMTAAEGVFLSGEFFGWPDPGEPMTDDNGDGVWEITVSLEPGTYQYKFQNGTPGGWEEGIPSECSVGDTGNREVVVGTEDIVMDAVCFETCSTDLEACFVSVSEDELEAGVMIFPNPTEDILNVRFELPEASENLNIRMVNTLGQTVYSKRLGQIMAENVEINVENLPAGTYMIQITDGETQVSKTIVKQ